VCITLLNPSSPVLPKVLYQLISPNELYEIIIPSSLPSDILSIISSLLTSIPPIVSNIEYSEKVPTAIVSLFFELDTELI